MMPRAQGHTIDAEWVQRINSFKTRSTNDVSAKLLGTSGIQVFAMYDTEGPETEPARPQFTRPLKGFRNDSLSM